MRAWAMATMVLASLAVAGCLQGERAPLRSIYGDPISQVPAITAPSGSVTSSGSSATGTAIPGLSVLGPPVAGSTTTTTQQTVDVWGPPGTTITSGTIYSDPAYRRGRSQELLPSGQPRYVYPRNDIRCDNALRRCDRWSAPNGRYIGDVASSRAVYGR